MGFEGKKVLKLNFADPELDGLEVVVRRPSVAQVLEVSNAGGDDVDENDIEGLRPTVELLCSLVVGWNLTNEDEHGVEHEVPKTADALLEQDATVVQAIIDAWEEHALPKVPDPLAASSPSGGPSLAESIPMETQSPSLAS